MIVFAWVLWVLFIVEFIFIFATFVGAVIAIGNGNKLRYSVSWNVFIDIAVFVFLSIYLFS